jgi:hypothetical protein
MEHLGSAAPLVEPITRQPRRGIDETPTRTVMTSEAPAWIPQDSPPAAGPVDQDALGSREQLRWFLTLWVMALAFHYTDDQPLSALPVLALCLPALIFPSSLLALGGVAAVAAVNAVTTLPAPANHKILSLLVALSFGGAAVWVLATRNRAGSGSRGAVSDGAVSDGAAGNRLSDRDVFARRWLETARTPAALSLLVIYSFTTFDKLNTAFFDPATSCAGTLLRQLLTFNGANDGLTLAPMMVRTAAIGTVLVEATILVCLAVPGLRRWGVPLGVGLHMVLAPASFWDFSTMVFAVYMLLLPASMFARLAPRSTGRRQLALTAFGVHMLLSITVEMSGLESGPFGVQWHTLLFLTWCAAVLPFMLPLVLSCLSGRWRDGAGSGGRAGSGWPGWRVRPVFLLLVPLLAFVNGAAPYLGLKTVGVYSMFSNLHTERGVTNHLITGLPALNVVPYERDTVTITQVRTDDGTEDAMPMTDWLNEKPPVTVPLLEVRRVVALWRDEGLHGVRVEYLRNGTPQVATDAITDPVLSAPPSWWQRHLLAFRAIDSGLGANICRW